MQTDRRVTLPSVHLEGPDPRVAVVDCGGQQGLPALRVVFVWQLSGAQFDVQNAVSAQDRPGGGVWQHQKVKTLLVARTGKRHFYDLTSGLV